MRFPQGPCCIRIRVHLGKKLMKKNPIRWRNNGQSNRKRKRRKKSQDVGKQRPVKATTKTDKYPRRWKTTARQANTKKAKITNPNTLGNNGPSDQQQKPAKIQDIIKHPPLQKTTTRQAHKNNKQKSKTLEKHAPSN